MKMSVVGLSNVPAINASSQKVVHAGDILMVLFRSLGPDVSLAEYKQRLEMISADLHRLLQLETQVFWNLVVGEKSILRCIDSFLRFSPRHWFELARLPVDPETHELLNSTSRLVFLVLLRLATNKETSPSSKDSSSKQPQQFLSPSEFAQLIYDKKVWSIPMLFDVVALYGRKNANILTKMMESLFKCQPKFNEDLAAAFSSTELALRKMAQQLDDLSIIKAHDNRSLLAQISDMVVFSFDTFSTLEVFINIYQPAASVIEQNCPTLLPFCAEFAESTLKDLTGQLSNMASITACQREDCQQLSVDNLFKIVAATEVRLVNTFRAIVSANSLCPPDQMHPELFFGSLTMAAGHHRFLWLYDQLHPINKDIVLLEKNCQVDVSVKEYIKGAVVEARRMLEPQQQKQIQQQVKSNVASGGPSKANIDSMVEAVRSVMGSDLDNKFVSKCLVRFDYQVEALIQALLDDNLPPDLRELQTVKTDRKQDEDDNYEYTSENIEAALASVHIGKRDTVLDRKEVGEMKQFYNKYSTVVTTVEVPSASAPSNYSASGFAKSSNMMVSVAEPGMEYEDEYDDTYDDNEGAVGPQGSAGDEMLKRRAFTVPRVLTVGADKLVESSSEESEEEEEEQHVQAYTQPFSAGRVRGGYGGGRGRGGFSAGQDSLLENKPGPRVGDTRGFKGANRDRQQISRHENKPRPVSDMGPRNARPLNQEPRPNQSQNKQHDDSGKPAESQNGNERQAVERLELPEDVQRMKKERNKGSVANHNRKDAAARKRREF